MRSVSRNSDIPAPRGSYRRHFRKPRRSYFHPPPEFLTAGVHMEPGSRAWYREVLLLSDDGAVPGLPGGGVKASKADCIAAFGPPTSAGRYFFRGRGSVQYEAYTLELLEQTQQEIVHSVTSLPYHFARGLLDEENGEVVNWALFALRRQHLHCRRKPVHDYLLPKYRGYVEVPIPFQHPKVSVGERLPRSEANNNPPAAATAPMEVTTAAALTDFTTTAAPTDCTTAGIPMPVRRGMGLLAPSIARLCNVVLAALEEEGRATANAPEDVCSTTLGVLQRRRATYSEELDCLDSALSLQEDVYNGLFKCREDAVTLRKRVKKGVKEALQKNLKPAVVDNLKATEEKCRKNIQQFVEWIKVAMNAKEVLQGRYNEEEVHLAQVEKDIQVVEVVHDPGSRTLDSRISYVDAFMRFVCFDVDSTAPGRKFVT